MILEGEKTMTYTIGEVAKLLNLSVFTIRYYDKEGLLPFIERNSCGKRIFSEADLSTLHIIECLKLTGMPIKEIKRFIDWCSQGDASLEQRYNMFLERKAAVEAQMQELKKTLEVIEYKCWYYKTALDAGTEAVHDYNQASEGIS
jgi:DNA-binding transcriptional MerR regulator